MTLYDD